MALAPDLRYHPCGSRHEGYGEKGMAHLLEHMLFKGSKSFPDIKSELTRRGARWNGTTSNDRTNYFETFSATPENLDWALAMEADRMVTSRVSRQDLDSEMTVVRNEFEMGENNPGSVLFQRMQQLAYAWHNYGNPTIGQRADIERVPIDKLQAFYRTWYQPDNAVLLIAGRFEEPRALELVMKHFAPLPKPARVLPAFYTEEPTQDGERTVTLARIGDSQLVTALYRIVAGSHPEYPAIDILVQILSDTPTGRLHRALVQKGLASSSFGAERYLKPANRVLGMFVPTERPERAEIPPTPDVERLLEGYRGGDNVSLGEAFDPSPKNIESRIQRRTLANGIQAALLPKQTRGGRAVATLTLHWGDEKTLMNREVACEFAGQMLMRGTKKRSRAELKEELEKLNARVSLSGEGMSLEVRGENLIPALRLAAEALREPSFPPAEFDELKRAVLTSTQTQLSDPGANAEVRLSRHLEPYPRGHRNYTPTLPERLEWIRKTTLKDAQSCYGELMGATGADFAAVGEFDADAMAQAVGELFGAWRNPHPFTRVPARHFDRPPLEDEVITPDKANAVLRGGENVRMRDDHTDFPALLLGNYLLGGASTSRIAERVREKEGLSYSTGSSFSASPLDEAASFRLSAIFAPQNRARVEQAIREEVARALKDGFSAEELEAGKKGILEARRLARTQDRALANRIGSYLFIKRTFAWDIELESKVAALTPAQVNDALRRHIDPAKLSLVMAGDFKKQ